MRLHRLTFPGALLKRGFWLYAWRIRCGDQEFYYVGRTGDSSSQYASSPFSRLGRHLDMRSAATANMLLRHIRRLGLDPEMCDYELLAFGPLFPEQTTLDLHRERRDIIAPLERALVELFRTQGHLVVGKHGRFGTPDRGLLTKVTRAFNSAVRVRRRRGETTAR